MATNRRPIEAIYLSVCINFWQQQQQWRSFFFYDFDMFLMCFVLFCSSYHKRPDRRDDRWYAATQNKYKYRIRLHETYVQTRAGDGMKEKEVKYEVKKGAVGEEKRVAARFADDGSMSMTVCCVLRIRYRNDWWPFSKRSRAQSNQISFVLKEQTENERMRRQRDTEQANKRKFSTTTTKQRETCPLGCSSTLACLVASIKSIAHIHTHFSSLFHQFCQFLRCI